MDTFLKAARSRALRGKQSYVILLTVIFVKHIAFQIISLSVFFISKREENVVLGWKAL